MPWNWRKRRAAPVAAVATDDQPSTSDSFAQPNRQELHRQDNKSTLERTCMQTSGWRCRAIGDAENVNNDNMNGITSTVVKHTTPVLFSTNRGLYLRTPKQLLTPQNTTSKLVNSADRSSTSSISRRSSGSENHSVTACTYDIQFCDLERWSTNRANTVSLEDTFTMRRRNCRITTPNLPAIDSSDSSSGGGGAAAALNVNNCFLSRGRNTYPFLMGRCDNRNPRFSTSLRTTFARFDIR